VEWNLCHASTPYTRPSSTMMTEPNFEQVTYALLPQRSALCADCSWFTHGRNPTWRIR